MRQQGADADSIWFTTRSALSAGGERGWEAIAAYGPAIARYLASRYPRLPAADRDDVAQDVLVAMRERLARAHDGSRGRFRQLLQVVLRRRVADLYRRRRAAAGEEALAEIPAPTDDDLEAIDLEAALVTALGRAADEMTRGPKADRDALYALADRVVHGRSNQAIAAAAGVSRDAVGRRLRKARERILHHLLAGALEPPPDEALLAVCVDAARAALVDPRERTAQLARIADRRLREALEAFLDRFAAARRHLPGPETQAGRELRRSLALILAGEREAGAESEALEGPAAARAGGADAPGELP